MLLTHRRLKVGGGQMLGMSLVATPLHEEAVAHAAEHPHDGHGRRAANAGAVVILRDVQPLMQAIFDAAKAGPVKLQPFLRIEFVRLGAGQQADVFVLTAFGLAQQPGCLGYQRKAQLFGRDRLGDDRAAHQAALFVIQGAELRGRRLPRGENPPWGRGAVAR